MIDPNIAYGAESMRTDDVNYAIDLYRNGEYVEKDGKRALVRYTWRDIADIMRTRRQVNRNYGVWNRVCTAIAPDLKELWKELRNKEREEKKSRTRSTVDKRMEEEMDRHGR